MRITTLIENRKNEADPSLKFEWGLSLHIAHNGRSILLDTGASGAFVGNAERLSVDLAGVEAMVLSHHHFDHGGGLGRFLEINTRARVYLAGEPEGDCYARMLFFLRKYIGLDKSLLSGNKSRFSVVDKAVEILPDVFVFPQTGGNHPKPAGNKRLFLQRDGRLALDPFAHEIILAIRDAGELVVFTGCSHNGIMNILDTVARHFPGVPVKAVIGGLHLVAASPFSFMADSKSDVEKIGRSLLDYPVARTYTGHCTCAEALKVLASVMGDRIAEIRTGSVLEV